MGIVMRNKVVFIKQVSVSTATKQLVDLSEINFIPAMSYIQIMNTFNYSVSLVFNCVMVFLECSFSNVLEDAIRYNRGKWTSEA